jgi:EAL domain-containing protein (putative c-di-GMP-specific phosphodiesterase class I)
LVNADIALYRAKKRGRCAHEFYSAEVQRQIVRYKAMADGVLAGIGRGEFVPHYQPQISADSSRIVGVEALARWYHPEEGVLGPDHFMQVVDDLGVVATLDRIVLERALEDLGRWRAAGLDIPKLSVNVSARRLNDRDLIASVSQLALPRGVIAFELLESVFLDAPDETISWNIDMLKEMGIEIELDDFGSGHASIISLVKLGPQAIKIDRELVSSITADRTRCGLVRSIIEIGRSLDTRVIAEGVESAAQAQLLHRLGCDALQGYHFGRPMPADEFLQFGHGWNSRDPAARETG